MMQRPTLSLPCPSRVSPPETQDSANILVLVNEPSIAEESPAASVHACAITHSHSQDLRCVCQVYAMTSCHAYRPCLGTAGLPPFRICVGVGPPLHSAH